LELEIQDQKVWTIGRKHNTRIYFQVLVANILENMDWIELVQDSVPLYGVDSAENSGPDIRFRCIYSDLVRLVRHYGWCG
jgi:hypothetical protein